MNRHQHLIQLAAKSEQLLQFRYEDDEGHLLRNTAMAGGTAGLGYAGLSAARGARHAAQLTGGSALREAALSPMASMRAGHSMNMTDLRNTGARAGAYARKIGRAGERGALQAVKGGGGILDEIWGGIKYAGRAAQKVRFGSREEALIQLAAKSKQLIQA